MRKARIIGILILLGGGLTVLLMAPERVIVPPQFQVHVKVNTRPVVQPRVYRNSLIPGGVKSVQDLRSKVERDRVLLGIFQNFKWQDAHSCSVPRGQYFISYRIGNDIRWTMRQGGLDGEDCITDGQRTVLTRCGNLVSFVPMYPEGMEWPNDLAMPEPMPEQPQVSIPGPSTYTQANPQSPVASPTAPVSPTSPPISIISWFPSPIPPTKVPEPCVLVLLIPGLIALIIGLRLTKGIR